METEQKDRDRYETDEEIREQPEGTAPHIRPDATAPEGGDWTVGGPKDEHGHGDIDDDEATRS